MTNFEETIEILYKFRYQTPVNETVNDALQKTIDIINKNSTIPKEYKIEIMLIIQDVLKQCSDENYVSKNTITICKKLVSILKTIKESNVPVVQSSINRLNEKINYCIQLYREKWELEKHANFPGLTGNSIVQLKIIKELPNFQNYILQRLVISFKTLEKSISNCKNRENENLDMILKTFEENEKKIKESISKLNTQIKAISNIHIKSEEFQSLFVNKNFKSQSEEEQKTDEKIQIVIDNNHECYINFDKIWNKNSRWHLLKNEILAKGLTKSRSLYFCLPIHRSIFVLGSGNFGNVEIGFSKTFHAVVIRRLTDFGMLPENCLNLIKSIKRISNIVDTNLLKSYIAQDVCGHTFYYNKLCDYNLSEYIIQMNANKLITEDLIKRISFQIVKGLAALHLNSPSIVHGNLKPTNVFIDENGILKLAEFGIYKVFIEKLSFIYFY